MKPISSNMFKLTAISAMILSATSASAALYEIIEISPPSSFESAYGVAIQPGNINNSDPEDEKLGCFSSSANQTECLGFRLAGETRRVNTHDGHAVDGVSYREEAPFGGDMTFNSIRSQRDFELYCRSFLGYATCNTWASVHWNEWDKERRANKTPNATAFIQDKDNSMVSTAVDNFDNSDTHNVVINSLTSNAEPIGIKIAAGDVAGFRRNSVQALVANTSINIDAGLQTRAWKTDGTYTVGSLAREETNNYTSKGAIWDKDGNVHEIPWETKNNVQQNRLAQASIRDFVVAGEDLYAVGYNTFYDDRNFMQASISKIEKSALDAYFTQLTQPDANEVKPKWETKAVSGATVRENGTSGDGIHAYSKLMAVNNNLIAVGEAKRSRAADGALTNRLFVVTDLDNPKAEFLTGELFFAGAGGKVGAINNFNEIVGQIDTEESREAGGKPRRKRGFIYPYGTDELQGSFPDRQAIFNNRAWLLDDLTNDGNVTGHNNNYRILDATDINDAGVISATALRCTGGYDSTAHNALCGAGKGEIKTVAVKLVPISGANSDDIRPRITTDFAVDRQGAGLGFWSLILGGLLWFRRK